MTAKAPKGARGIIRVLAVLAALGLLIWLLDHIGWNVIAENFERVGVLGAFILVLMGFVESGCDAAAVKAAGGHKVGLWRCMSYNGAGALINSVIPWDAGEVLKGSLMTRHMTTKEAVSSTVLWNYLFKLARPLALVSSALIGLLLAIPLGSEIPLLKGLMILGLCIVGFGPFVVVRFLIHYGLMGAGVRVLQKLKLQRKDPEKMLAAAAEVDHAMQRFRHERPGDFRWVVGYQYAARMAALFTYFVAMHLMGMDINLADGSLVYAALMVANWLVMLTPARVGVTEGAGYLVFSFLGLDGGLGLLVTLIMRIKALIVNGIMALGAGLRVSGPKPTPLVVEQNIP